MGWAKYSEDNTELTNERLYYLKNKKTVNTQNKNAALGTTQGGKLMSKNATESEGCRDIYLICRSCGKRFLFSAHAQRVYRRNGWCAPKRCKPCKEFAKAARLMRHSK
ncbi:MAG: zinc-ribbon domain containing protein [Clostridiales bacterium]|nr:zinc-ribbon domain containing protein [Clostridiales bacterium]